MPKVVPAELLFVLNCQHGNVCLIVDKHQGVGQGASRDTASIPRDREMTDWIEPGRWGNNDRRAARCKDYRLSKLLDDEHILGPWQQGYIVIACLICGCITGHPRGKVPAGALCFDGRSRVLQNKVL